MTLSQGQLLRRRYVGVLLVVLSIGLLYSQQTLLSDIMLSTTHRSVPSTQSSFLRNDVQDTELVVDSSSPARRRQEVIYSRLRRDQSGWVILDMLKAHSYAFFHNATYGGGCGESSHKEDIGQVLTAVGLHHILPLKCPDDDDNDNETNALIYLGSAYEQGSGKRLKSPEWLNYVKSQIKYPEKEENTTSIVVHIRRRDVTPCCYPMWYLPNYYFQAMIEKYRADDDHGEVVHVQIFSQSESFESWEPFNSSQYSLHLDGPIGDVWKAILSSDIFIGSKSEFSRVPAMFTRGHVMNAWQIGDDEIRNQTEIENERVFDTCTEYQIFSCKHKWWQQKRKRGRRRR